MSMPADHLGVLEQLVAEMIDGGDDGVDAAQTFEQSGLGHGLLPPGAPSTLGDRP